MHYAEVANPFKPRKVSEIRKKKEIKIKENPVIAIENLDEDEYVSLDRVLPKYYREARQFWKYGEHVEVKLGSGRLQQLIKRAMESFAGPKRGYGWFGTEPPNNKLFPLKEIIEGLELYVLKGAKVQDYGDRILACVPSREAGSHKLKLENLYTDLLEKAINISVSCDCEFHSYTRLGRKYRLPEDIFCAHATAALFKTAEVKKQIMQWPLGVPKEALVDFYDKLRENVIVKDGKRRTLSQAEMEILLWDYVSVRKPDGLFDFEHQFPRQTDYVVKFIS